MQAVYAVDCQPGTWPKDKQKPFVYNESFRCLKGHQYWKDGEVLFPGGSNTNFIETRGYRDTTYRTLFWAHASHNGAILANNDLNIRYGFRRMSGLRQPPDTFQPGVVQYDRYHAYEAYMTLQQYTFINENGELLDHLTSVYGPLIEGYTTAEEEAADHHADPHPKKQLRIQAYEELLETAMITNKVWLKSTTYKVKKDEYAKMYKYIRMIGDLGCPASLQGFRVTKFIKEAQEVPLNMNSTTFEYIKSPSLEALTHVFENLISPKQNGYFCYFSDDSCYSVRVKGIVYTFNVDISSCDASHSPQLFKAFTNLFRGSVRTDVAALVAQLCTPIVIMSPEDRRKKIKLASDRPRLYSGSTLTTVINNFASLLIGVSLSKVNYDALTRSEPVSRHRHIIMEGITSAAERVGYLVTCEPCYDYSHIQFLKNSPVYDTSGVLRPFLNLGVMLRFSGSCHRDLPGRGHTQDDWYHRARLFQKGLLQGCYPNASFLLLRNMRALTQGPEDNKLTAQIKTIVDKDLMYKVDQTMNETLFEVDMAEVMRRYTTHPDVLVTPAEAYELFRDFSTAGYGMAVAGFGTSKVLKLDYGISCPGS